MKEMLKRAARTFLQTAVGYIATNFVCISSGITEIDKMPAVLIGVAISAVAAGLSALMNMPANTLSSVDDDGEEDEDGR